MVQTQRGQTTEGAERTLENLVAFPGLEIGEFKVFGRRRTQGLGEKERRACGLDHGRRLWLFSEPRATGKGRAL